MLEVFLKTRMTKLLFYQIVFRAFGLRGLLCAKDLRIVEDFVHERDQMPRTNILTENVAFFLSKNVKIECSYTCM